jgi:hypothetical protein
MRQGLALPCGRGISISLTVARSLRLNRTAGFVLTVYGRMRYAQANDENTAEGNRLHLSVLREASGATKYSQSADCR